MYFPNKCGFCDQTNDLKKCTRCNLISYCGENHQKKHFKEHKKLCKVIAEILQELKLSHLYQDSNHLNYSNWVLTRQCAVLKVSQKLGRPLDEEEEKIFLMPRCCLICYETRNTQLINCNGCPYASFCQSHQNDPKHEKNCSSIKYCFLIESYNETFGPERENDAIFSMLQTPFNISQSPPSNMRDMVDKCLNYVTGVDEMFKMMASEYFSVPLTFYNALKKLNLCHTCSLTIHVGGTKFPFRNVQVWEALLHLMPNLKKLQVVYIGQEFEAYQVKLSECSLCTKNRQTCLIDIVNLSYREYCSSGIFKKPDIVAFLNIESDERLTNSEDFETDVVVPCSRVPSWLIITTTTKKKMIASIKEFQSASCFREIFGGDENQFASLKPQIDWRDGSVFVSNQQMTLFCPPARRHFYGTSCHVCHLSRSFITCEFCRMIFYCSEEHQQDDYIAHKDMCEVLTSMSDETETMCLFSHLKGANAATWMRGKIGVMLKAELRLGRRLLEYEEQMFLFPKACFVCHDNDLDVLIDCDCGVSLCDEHRDDPKHEEMCKELTLCFKLSTGKQLPVIQATVADVSINKSTSLPPSLHDFMQTYLSINNLIPHMEIHNFDELHMSDFLTRPLTLIYAIKQLDLDIHPTMVIHVVGASTFEIWSQKYWEILLFWFQNLKNLIVVFIGPEILEFSFDDVELTFSRNSFKDKRLIVFSPPVRYEDYCQHKNFVKPDIVIGFNLEIHEIEYGISSSTWGQMLQVLELVDVPFVLTTGSKERAQKDHEIMCVLLERSFNYFSSELNPFAGLIPERDFETEGLRYSNKYVTIYDRLRRGSSNNE